MYSRIQVHSRIHNPCFLSLWTYVFYWIAEVELKPGWTFSKDPAIVSLCCAYLLSHDQLFATPGLEPTRLLCLCGFSRQEHWSGLPCPPPGYLLNPGIKPRSPTLQADSLPAELPGKPYWLLQFSSVAQSCPTLCDPMDSSPLGSSVCCILQARKLEWVAMPSSRESSQPRDLGLVSCIGCWILYHWPTS